MGRYGNTQTTGASPSVVWEMLYLLFLYLQYAPVESSYLGSVIGLLTKTNVFKFGHAAGIRSIMYLRGYGTLPQRSSVPRLLGR